MTSFLALVFIFPIQENPLMSETYRGPAAEVFREQATTHVVQSGQLPDGWDRWEFWFEQEKMGLFLGSGSERELLRTPSGSFGTGHDALSSAAVTLRAVPLFMEEMNSRFPEVREAAALSLGRSGDARGLAPLLEATRDGSPQVRQAAFLGLGLLNQDRALVHLAECWSDQGRKLEDRMFAVLAIGLSGRRVGGELLQASLKRELRCDRLYGQQELALQALIRAAGMQGSPAFVDVLIQAADRMKQQAPTASVLIRGEACRALGMMKHSSARVWLEAQLHSGEIALERAAAQALGSLGDQDAIASLNSRYLAGGDTQTQFYCLVNIGRLGGSHADKILTEFYESTKSHRQLRAAWALAVGLAQASSEGDALFGEFVSRKPSESFEESIKASDIRRDEERLRSAFALGIALYGDKRAITTMEETLFRSGVDAGFAGYLCMAMGRLGGPSAEPALRQYLEQDPKSEATRRGLAWGLSLSGTSEAARLVAGMCLSDRSSQVRWTAARSLMKNRSQIGFDQLISGINQLKSAKDVEHKAVAISALGFLVDPFRGDRMSSLIEGADFRRYSSLQRVLCAY